ncbi:hypothetical protein [Microbacterium sp. VKM Ac-2923]|uniref:hypothetical protein n=1 Tax=Microbacterium sp. VKM Ac-2923 TaxID=2929476 RepID=UPI001FB40E2B|nr:hypothetical protein [Microbacterium sp. VKM Ac-2923]MCJ1707854.1 hypothetical protein [Microbacterium sp. VKM Ac-2923]
MDFTRADAHTLGSALTRIGVTWNYDKDGDIRLRFRGSKLTDGLVYQLNTDWTVQGEFLGGRAVPQPDGSTAYEFPRSGRMPTAIAQKVVTAYLMPRPQGLLVQVHLAVFPLDQPRPFHIKIAPNPATVHAVELRHPGFTGTGDGRQFWMTYCNAATNASDDDFSFFISHLIDVGRDLFEAPFTGWMFFGNL